MRRIIVGGRARGRRQQDAVRNQFRHPFAPIDQDTQLRRLRARAHHRNLVDRQRLDLAAIHLHGAHPQRIEHPLLGRRQPRRSLRLEASGVLPGGLDANVTVHNISAAGLLIETAQQMDVGEVLAIDLPNTGPVGVEVVWQSGQLYGCAFEQALGEAALAATQLRGTTATATTAQRSVPPTCSKRANTPSVPSSDVPDIRLSTCIAGRSARRNGFVATSRSSSAGTVGRLSDRRFSIQATYSFSALFSGSIVTAKRAFEAVYSCAQ